MTKPVFIYSIMHRCRDFFYYKMLNNSDRSLSCCQMAFIDLLDENNKLKSGLADEIYKKFIEKEIKITV